MQTFFLSRILRRKAHKKKGQSIIIVALAMLMIVAVLALTLNVQQLTSSRASIQTAADSAALAGANIQAQGKQLVKVCEMLRFVRDLVVALIKSIAIIIRDISYAFTAIGIIMNAASPFCFCAGMWAFPIAAEVYDAYQEVDQVATEAEEATKPFYEGLAAAEEVTFKVTPFIALVNAYTYGQDNGAEFTLPLPLPITDKKNDAFTFGDDGGSNAILDQIKAKNDRIKQIEEHDIPAAQYAILDQLKIYDVLSLKIDRHDDARLQKAIAERASTSPSQVPGHEGDLVSICDADLPFFNPCPKLDDEIATATAQRDSPNPDDTEALQKAKDDYNAAGCNNNPPPPSSTCDPLQQGIDDAQKQLDDDKAARDAAAILAGDTIIGGAALQYQSKINQLKAEDEQLKQQVSALQVQYEAARQAAFDKAAAEIDARDISFGRAGMEGIMVIVVKKGEPPITNFGGKDPGKLWAAAFGLTVTTGDPALIYGHASMNLIDALGKSNGGLASSLTSIGGWAADLIIKFSKQAINADAEVENWLKEHLGPVYDFLKFIGLPVFDLTRPDIHDVRPRLVKVDAGLVSSMARINTEDAYDLTDGLPETLQKANEYLQKWRDLASIGVPGPPDCGVCNDLFSDDSLF